LQVICERS